MLTRPLRELIATAFLLGFVLVAHAAIKFSAEIFNLIFNLGKRASGSPVPEIPVWVLAFLGASALFFCLLLLDAKVCGTNLEEYSETLYPIQAFSMAFLGLDLIFNGEFLHKSIAWLPASLFACCIAYQSLLIYRLNNNALRILLRISLIAGLVVTIILLLRYLASTLFPYVIVEDIIGVLI